MTATRTTGRVICARCRHPRPLHSNGETECKARGCHSGPDGGPCLEFVAEIVPAAEPAVLAPAFREPAYEDLPAVASQ
jgi:hypothetical protein